MKRNRKYWVVVLCAIIIVGLLSGAAISEESITIIGTINEDYQIVADDGQLFIFAEPEKVKKLDEIIKMKVKVTGTVEESEGLKVVTITSYEVIGEKTVTIVGTINADYRIVADDGQVYEIEDNEKGGELIELVGKKVKVMAVVGEYKGMKIIFITSYEVIEK